MDDFASLYIKRKLGEARGWRYGLSVLAPALLLFLVTSCLVFSLSFICSLSEEIDRMLQVLGSGSVYSSSAPDLSLLPEGSQVDRVASAEALVYTEGGQGAVLVKGVGEDYFSGLRAEALDLGFNSLEGGNLAVTSSSLAERLSLSPGDKMTLLVYDRNLGRTRPLLCSFKGSFQSVYPQLDSHLLFLSGGAVSQGEGYEILLPEGEDAEEVARQLGDARSYKTMYYALYSNARSSVSLLYMIFVLVSLLAAFFSSDIAEVYVARDRKDLAHLLLMGATEKRLRALYFRMTLSVAASSCVTGAGLGILSASLSPSLVKCFSGAGRALMENYVLSFKLVVPWEGILFMLLLMMAIASVSVRHTLRRLKLADIFLL